MTEYVIKNLTGKDRHVYDEFVSKIGGSFLQTSAWSEVKSLTGWSTKVIAVFQGDGIIAGAQIFVLSLPFGQKISYVPHGPVWDPEVRGSLNIIIKALKDEAVGLALRIEPGDQVGLDLTRILSLNGYTKSPRALQPLDTIVINLSQDESELMSGMRQTTRRYIRQAERWGLRVWEDANGSKIADFYEILSSLGTKVGFGVHSLEYYRGIKDKFGDGARIFFVSRGQVVLGSYFLIAQGDRSWELYGGVTPEGQELKAGYLLKWRSLLAMKESGIRFYDQWGVAPVGDTTHKLAGVTYFKEGFGGERVVRIGAYDLVRNEFWYRLINLADWVRGRRG